MDPISATLGAGALHTYSDAKKSQRAQKRLVKDYEKAYKRAYEENLARYNQILSEMGELQTRQLASLDQRGESQRREIAGQARRSSASVGQNLAQAGLGSSTIAQTMRNSIGRQQTDDLVGLKESLNRERMDLDRALTSNRHQFMASRTDAYPDMGYLQLRLGQAGQPSPLLLATDRAQNDFYRAASLGTDLLAGLGGGQPSGASAQPQGTRPFNDPNTGGYQTQNNTRGGWGQR
jgi:hypothetical protein